MIFEQNIVKPRMMAGSAILILTALRFEADAMAPELGLRFATPTMASNGKYINLRVIGPRAARLPNDVPPNCAGIILAGVGGGLLPRLRRGDLVIDERSTLDLSKLAAPRVKFVTASQLIGTPAAKSVLHDETGGAVVDMETDIVRDWAIRHGLPMLSVRVISDTADETLHPSMMRFVDEAGFTRPTRIVKEILKNPFLIPHILRLRHSGPILRQLGRMLAISLEPQ